MTRIERGVGGRSLPRRGPGTSTLLHAMPKLGYVWFHMFSLKVFVYSKEHSAYSENKVTVENTSSGRLNEVKNNGKSLTVRPKK